MAEDYADSGMADYSQPTPLLEAPPENQVPTTTTPSYDPMDTYVQDVVQAVTGWTQTSNDTPGESSVVPGDPLKVAGPVNTNSGGGLIDTLKQKFFPDWKDNPRDPNEFSKMALAGGAGLGFAALRGAGTAYTEAQKRKLEERKVNTDALLAQSQVNLNATKTDNRLPTFGGSGGGLLNYRPAGLTSVTQRRPA